MTRWKPTRRDVMVGFGGATIGGVATAAGALAYRQHHRQAQIEALRAFQAASDTDDGWLISPKERADLSRG